MEDFHRDPMGWFAVFSYEDYLDMARRGAAGINAMLAEKYLAIIN